MRTARLAAAIASMLTAGAVQAQDVVVMRRTVAPARIADAPSHQVGEWRTGAWRSQCSTATSRDVSCVAANGDTLDGSRCPGQRPAAAGENLAGCSYRWATSPLSEYSPSCSTAATRTQSVSCVAYAAGETAFAVGIDACSGAGTRPTGTSDPVDNETGCTWSWKPGPWASACSKSTTRSVVCERLDGKPDADGRCAGTRPDATGPNYSGCTLTWNKGDWVNDGPAACGTPTPQTRTVTCHRSSGDDVPDAQCVEAGQGAKPATTQTLPASYANCGSVMPNPGAEEGTTPWAGTATTTVGMRSGARAFKMTRAGSSDSDNPGILVPGNSGYRDGAIYRFTFWVRGQAAGNLRVRMYDAYAQSNVKADVTVSYTTTYTRFTVDMTAKTAGGGLGIRFNNLGNGDIWLDDYELVQIG